MPFPKLEEEFKDDDRVSFDTTKQNWILEDEDGKEHEWNQKYSSWIETMDDALVQAQQSAYGAPEPDIDAEPPSKKRKADDKSAAPGKKAKKEPTERVNSSVYATGLPLDTTFDELYETFKRFGLIANNIDSETPRIKMYANDDGSFKGEALITYFRPESVQQAIYLLDGSDFRTGTSGTMHVEAADMSFKKTKEYQSSGPQQKRSRKDVDKIKRMTNNMNARLADWDDDDPSAIELEVKPASKWDKTVIVKRMFTLQEIEEEPELLVELPEDLREKATEEQWGEISNVTIFDLEEEGVVKLKFRDAVSASKAVMAMDGRFFGGKQLLAYIPDKKEVYRKRDRDEEEEEERLKKYGEELEREGQ